MPRAASNIMAPEDPDSSAQADASPPSPSKTRASKSNVSTPDTRPAVAIFVQTRRVSIIKNVLIMCAELASVGCAIAAAYGFKAAYGETRVGWFHETRVKQESQRNAIYFSMLAVFLWVFSRWLGDETEFRVQARVTKGEEKGRLIKVVQ